MIALAVCLLVVIAVLEALQYAQLGNILDELRIEQPPVIHIPVREDSSAPAPEIPPGPSIWARLERKRGEWVLAGHVRERTPAWQEALDTPKVALRSPSGELVEGQQ